MCQPARRWLDDNNNKQEEKRDWFQFDTWINTRAVLLLKWNLTLSSSSPLFIYLFIFIFYLLSGQMWCKDAVTLCTSTDMHATLSWGHTCRRSTFIRMMWNVVACESWVKGGKGMNTDFQERSPDREQNRLLLHIAPFKLVFILDSLAPFTTLHSLWG